MKHLKNKLSFFIIALLATSMVIGLYKISNTPEVGATGVSTVPIQVASVLNNTSLNGGKGVFVSGNFAYTVEQNNGYFAVWNITTPSSPVQIGNYVNATSLSGAQNVYVSGNYAYVSSNSGNYFAIINVTDPKNPTQLSAIGGVVATDVFVSGNYAYVTDGTIFKIYNITTPSLPTEIGTLTNSTCFTSSNGVYKSGNYAYVAAGGSTAALTVINVTVPSTPTWVGSIKNATSLTGAYDVYGSGNYMYVTANTNKSMTVIDVTNPVIPTQVGFISNATTLNSPRTIRISGNYAYIVSNTGKSLTIFDITTPSNPIQYGYISNATSLNGVYGLAISGNYAYTVEYVGSTFTVFNIGAVSLTFTSSPVTGSGHLIVNGSAQTTPYTIALANVGDVYNITANQAVNSFISWTSTSIGTQSTASYNYTVPATGETITENVNTNSPIYSGITTNATLSGSVCNFSVTWNDNSTATLSKYMFGDNVTGSWVNSTAWTAFGSTPQTISNITTLPSSIGIVQYEWWANDTSGVFNNTSIQSLSLTDGNAPTYSNIATNSTSAGSPIQFDCKWTDDVAVSGYIFGTNNTGTFTNVTWTTDAGTSVWANDTAILNSTAGVKVSYEWWANDTSNNWNNTGLQILTTTDVSSPTFGAITGNTTYANHVVNYSTTISDNIAVSGFIASWNNTGIWSNSTWTSGSSGSKIGTLNSTVGSVISVIFYANDTSNNWATSTTTNFTLTDGDAPTYSNIENSTNKETYNSILSSTWTDETGLSFYIFSTNVTGTWVNATATAFTDNPQTVSSTITLGVMGETDEFIFYANDTSNNWNDTGIQIINVGSQGAGYANGVNPTPTPYVNPSTSPNPTIAPTDTIIQPKFILPTPVDSTAWTVVIIIILIAVFGLLIRVQSKDSYKNAKKKLQPQSYKNPLKE